MRSPVWVLLHMHTLGCPHACRRQEVLRIPLQLVQMVASRVTARLIRSTLLPAEGPGREARPDMDDLPTPTGTYLSGTTTISGRTSSSPTWRHHDIRQDQLLPDIWSPDI